MTKKGLSPRNLDVRIVQRKIAKGVVDEKEYNKYVEELPDLVEACVAMDLSDSDEPSNGESKTELGVAPMPIEA